MAWCWIPLLWNTITFTHCSLCLFLCSSLDELPLLWWLDAIMGNLSTCFTIEKTDTYAVLIWRGHMGPSSLLPGLSVSKDSLRCCNKCEKCYTRHDDTYSLQESQQPASKGSPYCFYSKSFLFIREARLCCWAPVDHKRSTITQTEQLILFSFWFPGFW